MINNNKVFILLPDGIGLRNFAYSNFCKIGKDKGFDVVFWNNTPFDLKELGFKELKIKHAKSNSYTELYKNARKQIELNLSVLKTKDRVYDTYRFPYSYHSVKGTFKSIFTQLLSKFYTSADGLKKIQAKINELERGTSYYQQCLVDLKRENPAIVLSTNQRPMAAIAPLLAAQDLGIPTATFIFSWDNLPKATMVVETDYYFVWSNHMKKELLFYYPYITEAQVMVTGTPQFESHFDVSKLLTREKFFLENGLDLNKKYICYSGDDITTCPDDPQYLEDLAIAVEKLNEKGYSLGVIFRRCPVDFSSRFDEVLRKYKELIVAVAPQWKMKGDSWNTILPTPEDVVLQMNTIAHTEMVVNLGSSMVFDYAAHDKPCAYINYDVKSQVLSTWSVDKIYNYIHFRSMPTKEAVIWLNSSDEIVAKIEKVLYYSKQTVHFAKDWFETINQQPSQEASERIWDSIKKTI